MGLRAVSSVTRDMIALFEARSSHPGFRNWYASTDASSWSKEEVKYVKKRALVVVSSDQNFPE